MRGKKITYAEYRVDEQGRGMLHLHITNGGTIIAYSENGKVFVEVSDKTGACLKIYGENTK